MRRWFSMILLIAPIIFQVGCSNAPPPPTVGLPDAGTSGTLPGPGVPTEGPEALKKK